MIIKSISYDNKTIELSGDNHTSNSNIFTLIIGRNGSGKSALLKKICLINISSALSNNNEAETPSSYLDHSERNLNFSHDNTGTLIYKSKNIEYSTTIKSAPHLRFYMEHPLPPKEYEHLVSSFNLHIKNSIEYLTNLKQTDNPATQPKIIAVSSSPFDKFPIINQHFRHLHNLKLNNHYIYRGARVNSRSGTKSYLESKFDQLGSSLINFFIAHETRKNEILPLFDYLGLKPNLKVTLKSNFFSSLDEISNINGRSPIDAVHSARFFKGISSDDHTNLSQETQERIINSAKIVFEKIKEDNVSTPHRHDLVYTLDLNINSTQQPPLLQELSTLVEFDLLDLENIQFTKTKSNVMFNLTDASSGELCILFNILSIAGSISDNTVVLLDEPELSLHPEWQKNFLPLLQKIFSKYKNCHFIIATHSPQVVSSVSSENSYIINLEDTPSKIIDGKKVSSQSSDFQLAYTFKSPGPKNEYLISQTIGALSQIRDGKKLDKEFLEKINELIAFYHLTPQNDPAQKLISTLIKALNVIRHD